MREAPKIIQAIEYALAMAGIDGPVTIVVNKGSFEWIHGLFNVSGYSRQPFRRGRITFTRKIVDEDECAMTPPELRF